jgi:hypothetical protein
VLLQRIEDAVQLQCRDCGFSTGVLKCFLPHNVCLGGKASAFSRCDLHQNCHDCSMGSFPTARAL